MIDNRPDDMSNLDFRTEICSHCSYGCVLITYTNRDTNRLITKVIPNCCPRKAEIEKMYSDPMSNLPWDIPKKVSRKKKGGSE